MRTEPDMLTPYLRSALVCAVGAEPDGFSEIYPEPIVQIYVDVMGEQKGVMIRIPCAYLGFSRNADRICSPLTVLWYTISRTLNPYVRTYFG